MLVQWPNVKIERLLQSVGRALARVLGPRGRGGDRQGTDGDVGDQWVAQR